MEEGGLSLRWLPLSFLAPVLTTATLRALLPSLSIDLHEIISAIGLTDPFIFSLLVYEVWTLVAAISLCLILRRGRVPLARIGLRNGLSLKAAGYSALGALAAFLIYPLIETIVRAIGLSMYWAGRTYPLTLTSSSDLLLAFILAAISAPILEEIIYRGYVLTALLERGLRTPFALSASALIFAAIHYAFGPGFMAYIFLWAFIPSLLYLKFGSLYPGMLMHSLNNLMAYVVFPLLI